MTLMFSKIVKLTVLYAFVNENIQEYDILFNSRGKLNGICKKRWN